MTSAPKIPPRVVADSHPCPGASMIDAGYRHGVRAGK